MRNSAVVLCLALAACDEGGGGAVDAGSDPDAGDAIEAYGEGCTSGMETADVVYQSAIRHEEEDFWIYEGIIDGDVMWPPVTMLQLEIRPGMGGPAGPGTYAIAPGPYAECGLCLLVREACRPEDGVARCERDYLAVEGTVEIVELGAVGEMLSGSITGAVLEEALIDWDSGAFGSEPVVDGLTWCLGSMEIEIGVSPYPAR